MGGKIDDGGHVPGDHTKQLVSFRQLQRTLNQFLQVNNYIKYIQT
jgi:hypothetical protein